MKYYTYNDPVDTTVIPIVNVVRTVSEKEILDQYWVYWSKLMIDRMYNPIPNGRIITKDMITIDLCIDDWVVNAWAWETDKDGKSIK